MFRSLVKLSLLLQNPKYKMRPKKKFISPKDTIIFEPLIVTLLNKMEMVIKTP